MHITFFQTLIDILRGKKYRIFECAKQYLRYRHALNNVSNFPEYKIIFKFDDLIDCNKNVKELDKFIKKEDLKACWGIIGSSMENADTKYIDFIKNSNGKNYRFFNHGYTHQGYPDYEFQNKSKDEQEKSIRKTQDIVYQKTGIILNSFGTPCNKIDENTMLALENIPEIQYWFFGNENYSKINLPDTTSLENGVGNPDFVYFIENLKQLNNDTKVIVFQGHPYKWEFEQKFNFYLIIKFLKKLNCKFIFPEETGDLSD